MSVLNALTLRCWLLHVPSSFNSKFAREHSSQALKGTLKTNQLRLVSNGGMHSRFIPARMILNLILASRAAQNCCALSLLRRASNVPASRESSYNSPQFSTLISPAQIRALGEGEVVIIDDAFDVSFARNLAADVGSVSDSSLEKLGVSRSVIQAVSDDGMLIRGDLAGWFDSHGRVNGDDSCATNSLSTLWGNFEELRLFLNKEAFLSLRRQDCQLARYSGDGSARYMKHLDAFRDDCEANRQITALFYFNENWTKEDGGCLRIWHGEESVEVLPILNRLVLFRSELVFHEVMPSTRTRHAATAWYYSKDSV